jgi:hypothetical protein
VDLGAQLAPHAQRIGSGQAAGRQAQLRDVVARGATATRTVGACVRAASPSQSQVGMKTEQKYSKLTVFVFYIMNRFLT